MNISIDVLNSTFFPTWIHQWIWFHIIFHYNSSKDFIPLYTYVWKHREVKSFSVFTRPHCRRFFRLDFSADQTCEKKEYIKVPRFFPNTSVSAWSMLIGQTLLLCKWNAVQYGAKFLWKSRKYLIHYAIRI